MAGTAAARSREAASRPVWALRPSHLPFCTSSPSLISARQQQNAVASFGLARRHGRNDMAGFFALVLAVIGGLFVYLALHVEGGLSLTQLGPSVYYLTVALVAFVNAALCAAALFVEE